MRHNIYIGLGGAGCACLGHLKAIIKRNEPVNDSKFIFTDTSLQIINTINSQYFGEFGRNIIDTDQELIDIGKANPRGYYRNIQQSANKNTQDKHFLNWVDPKAINSFTDGLLVGGASGIRIQGRSGLTIQHIVMENQIRNSIGYLNNIVTQLLTEFKRADTNAKNSDVLAKLKPTFWVFTGSVGGTGSSMTLDVLHLIFRLYKEQFRDESPIIKGGIFMPERYINIYRKENPTLVSTVYQPNAYSFFKEIDIFLRERWANKLDADGNAQLTYHTFDSFSVKPDLSTKSSWDLFTHMFMIDDKTGGSDLGEAVIQNTANMVYYFDQGAGAAFTDSFDDSVRDHLRQSIGTDHSWMKGYLTMGYRALRTAKPELKEYIKRRFKYDFIKQGLLAPGFEQAVPPRERKSCIISSYEETINKHLNEFAVEGTLEYYFDQMKQAAHKNIDFSPFMLNGKASKDFLSNPGKLDNLLTSIKTALDLITPLEHGEYLTFQDKYKVGLHNFMNRMISSNGLLYTHQVLGLLESEADTNLKSLESEYQECKKSVYDTRRSGLLNQLVKLEELINDYKRGIGALKSGKTVLQKLLDLTNSLLEDKINLQRTEARIKLLRWLCEGNNGYLDMLILSAKDLITKATDICNELHDNYNVNLKKQFASANTPTEMVVPELSRLCNSGGWVPDNAFDKIYSNALIVEKGKLSIDTISDVFRNRVDIAEQLIPGLETVANARKRYENILGSLEQYICADIFGLQVIKEEVEMSISDKFDNLDKKTQAIYKSFLNQPNVFFTELAGPARTTKTTYVCDNIQFAQNHFGYNQANGGLIPANDPGLFMVLQVMENLGPDDYAYMSGYEDAYNRLKEEHPEKFYPHIHRQFNEKSGNLYDLIKQKLQELVVHDQNKKASLFDDPNRLIIFLLFLDSLFNHEVKSKIEAAIVESEPRNKRRTSPINLNVKGPKGKKTMTIEYYLTQIENDRFVIPDKGPNAILKEVEIKNMMKHIRMDEKVLANLALLYEKINAVLNRKGVDFDMTSEQNKKDINASIDKIFDSDFAGQRFYDDLNSMVEEFYNNNYTF